MPRIRPVLGASGVGHVLGTPGVKGNGLLNCLVAYWPGNEADGTAFDYHTNALHLTQSGNPLNNTGLVYPTARQYVQTSSQKHYHADDALLRTGDIDFTFATWVRLDTKTNRMFLITKGSQFLNKDYYLEYYQPTDRFRFALVKVAANFISPADSFGDVPTGEWIFIVAWHDFLAGAIRIQINNGPVDTYLSTDGCNATNNMFYDFTIGAVRSNGYYFDGRIGPTAFWKSAAGGCGVLTSDQRTALWNGGLGLPYAAYTT